METSTTATTKGARDHARAFAGEVARLQPTIPAAHALTRGDTYLVRVYAYTKGNTNPGVLLGASGFSVG